GLLGYWPLDGNSSDMSGNFYLTFGIVDDSEFYSDPPFWFQEPVVYDESNLPLIIIDTYGAEIPDEPRIPAYMGIIDNESGVNQLTDDFNDYDGHITIERRGNSSQWNDKRPYRFETVDQDGENNNVALLGMPEENDWVLYAPWQDKTMIRNVLAYQLSNDMGRYASRTRYVELYLNGDYQGIYVLMEKIKRDNNRVNISKLNPEEIEGDDLTGGYILKFDWFFTGDNIGGFQSDNDGMTYNYHYPKPSDIVPEQEEYIQNYIDDFESIMLSSLYADSITGYPSKMNVESFVDFILVQELAKNVDAYRLSTYIYKDKDSIDNRLTAGPVWDFNHGFGNCDYGQTWEPENWLLEYNPEGGDQMSFWWELLWQDENFRAKVSDRYSELRSNIFSESHIFEIIDSSVVDMGESINRNFLKWPVLGIYLWPNFQVFDTYEEEILYLKSWISQRLSWMDSQILQLDLDKHNGFSNYAVHHAYPNPYNSTINIKYDLQSPSNVKIAIHDILGREIKILLNTRQLPGSKIIQWDSTNNMGDIVSAGVYLYSIEIDYSRDVRKIIYLK
ncbi:MAG: CotH kinase family protein, partial [Candidatus Neomarinimicrobiota bacterium]